MKLRQFGFISTLLATASIAGSGVRPQGPEVPALPPRPALARRPDQHPEGISAGTPVANVRATFPATTELATPQRAYRFDGLLARDGDRAYLFLHDGATVRKVVAGYADWACRFFDEGYGPC